MTNSARAADASLPDAGARYRALYVRAVIARVSVVFLVHGGWPQV